MCAPLTCSNILGAPNEGFTDELLDALELFRGYYEDVWMHTFICTLEDKADKWFYYCPN
jgi:hypothetical protein